MRKNILLYRKVRHSAVVINKNALAFLLAVSICLLFAGCGTEGNKEMNQKAVEENRDGKQEIQETSESKEMTDSQEAAEENDKADDSTKEKGNISLLCNRSMSFLSETGYYYITEDGQELKNGEYGRHIMYMDFATKKEVYLCNEPGCRHRDAKCTSVLTDEIGRNCLLFAAKDKLYLLSRDMTAENTVTTEFSWDGSGDAAIKKIPTVLYSMGLDGTNRKKEYTFEQDVTVDDIVLWDGKALYFAAKKISTSKEKDTSYTTASERELVKFNTKDFKFVKVCSLGTDEEVKWQIAGCSGGRVILRGTKYNQKLSLKEQMKLGDKELWDYQNDSKEVYAWLNTKDGSVKEIYSVKNRTDSENSSALIGNYLYVSHKKTKEIEKVDVRTGEAQKLATIKNGFIAGTLSDKLICQDWNGTGDQTLYFMDVNSGKTEHCTLVNKCTGWNLEIIGETGQQVLAIYDYEAEEEEEGVWEIYRKQYGLIDKKDLYRSADSFQKIAMKEKGE